MDLPGAIDLHVHYGPAPIPPEYQGVCHSVTAVETVREAADAGFRAVVLKAKDSSTAGLAHAVEEVVDGIRVFGGLVLDYPVGGLNPAAVEQTLLLGGKVIWLPTTGSRCDCQHHGPPPGPGFAPIDDHGVGIAVLDDDGKLLPVVHEIFELVATHGALLATGHIGFEEHLAVGRELGPSGRVIATHVGNQASGPKLGAAQCAALAEVGVIMEFTAATCQAHWGGRGMSLDEHVDMIRRVGVDHAILSSDYGWTQDLPRPVPGMLDYYDELWQAGFTEAELQLMACETPARLLGLTT